MTLLQPIWLVLLVPLLLALWAWRPPTRLMLALRALSFTLLLLSVCGLTLRLPSRVGTVVVVVDRSLSMPPDSSARAKEMIDLIQAERRGDDRLAVVAFGERVAVEQPPQTAPFAGFVNEVGGNASRIAEALDTALALVPPDSPGRVLLLSDGRWTGRDPAGTVPLAAGRGVAIDYRLLQRPAADDLAIARIDAPATVDRGEAFFVTAWVQAPSAQKVTFELRRGDAVLTAGERDLEAGLNRLTFRDRAVEPGNQEYTLRVNGTRPDPVPENNTARVLVGVRGPRPILHVTSSPKSGLAQLLKGGGLAMKVARPETLTWSLEELSRHSAVVLENVAAEKVGRVGMESLAAWVSRSGGGLMMTGGQQSYGMGGYYKSPLEPILPVTMELREEHRKLAMAIVVVLDRSGSMAAPVGGGKRKMDLANLGTVAVLDLLGSMDEFGCIAVDTEPHTIVNLAPVQNKDRARRDILRIESMGGGIYVYVALEAALKMLVKAKAGTKHIILFADASDAEEPGRYPDLLAQCREAGITVSVIGLGAPTDVDADLLRDIARLGNGRAFFSDKPEELPRLFAQDTFVVARNTFIDEATAVRMTPGLATIMPGAPAGPAGKALGGYNLCYLRPEATLATETVDDYKAPVVASWRAGLGRVVCFTGEADGKYAGALPKWEHVGDYYTSLARWAAGRDGLPGGMLLTQELRGGVNTVRLHLSPRRKGEPFRAAPRATTLWATPGKVPRMTEAPLRWNGADELVLEVPLEGNETALTTVAVPGQGSVALPPVCLPYSPEFQPALGERGGLTLERLAGGTGGKERLELPSIWKDLPRRPRLVPLAPWLLSAALLVLLLEVLERRTGLLSRPVLPRVESALAARPVTTAPAAAVAAPAEAQKAEPESKPAAQGGMVEALRKARERARRREM
jgi:Mg-chelatase subunit ChlD